MKTITLWGTLCALLFSLNGCVFDDDGFFGCERGEGPIVVQSVELPDLEGIKVSIDADVYLTQGPIQSIEIEGEENVIESLDLDVDRGIWKIRFDGCVRRYEPLRIYITLDELEEVELAGSGTIYSENFFTTNNLDLKISGAGNIDLAVYADKVDGTISGSGQILLEGTTKRFDHKVSGAGDIRSFGLLAEKGDAKISGSGFMEVYAEDRLDVKISGSGNVYYRGNPNLDINITGSGQVVDAN
jgi:hypothetical protein